MIGKRAKKERRVSAQRVLVRCFALPFAPARLADGLELEVFYVTAILRYDSPRVPLNGTLVPPRRERILALLRLRQTIKFQGPYYSSK